MSLPTLKLDDRNFQQIVDELKQRIHLYAPEWTDHNVSDPGVTLIELFAWAIEQLLYRLNQVPDLHYITFLKFLGIRIPTPAPASAELIFRLSAPQRDVIKIPASTQASTTQSELEEPYLFTLNETYKIYPADYDVLAQQLFLSNRNQKVDWNWRRFENRELEQIQQGYSPLDVFTKKPPESDEAFYVGFTNDLSNHLICLELECKKEEGSGIYSTNPPWSWEVSSNVEDAWVPCDPGMIKDETRGLNQSGRIELCLPQMGKMKLKASLQDSPIKYWLRVRLLSKQEIEEQNRRLNTMTRYDRSPQLLQLKSIGSIGRITHARCFHEIKDEVLGVSTGEPGQRFRLRSSPVLERVKEEEYIITENLDGSIEQWHETDSFADNDVKDPFCYVVDAANGEVRFPPYLRQEDGTIKEYGEIPKRGATIRFLKYRAHGTEMNVSANNGNLPGSSYAFQNERKFVQSLPPKSVNQLRTSLPYIDSVENLKPTQAAQSLPDKEVLGLRVLSELRTRDRAVTLEDYKLLVESKFSDRILHVYPSFEPIEDSEMPTRLLRVEEELKGLIRSNVIKNANDVLKPVTSEIDELKEQLSKLLGVMRIYVMPKPSNSAGNDASKLTTAPTVLREIEDYLNQRQAISMHPVQVRDLRIRAVALAITLKVTAEGLNHKKQIEETVKGILNRYIDPFKGGKDGQGWKPGAPITTDDIRSVIQKHSGLSRLLTFSKNLNEHPILVQQQVENINNKGTFANANLPEEGIKPDTSEVFQSAEHTVKVES